MRTNQIISNYLNPNNLLLLSLLGFLLLMPLLPVPFHRVTFNFFLFAMMFSAVFSFNDRNRKYSAGLAIVLTVAIFSTEFLSLERLDDLFKMIISLFFVWTVIMLIRQTVRSATVTQRVIVDSISAYLMLGVIYVIMVKLLFQINPEAYKFPDAPDAPVSRLIDLIYFTFITYTSTGYGDILPASHFAKMLSVLIGISGQLYIAIIIALLVGKFSSGPSIKP